jgi:putative Mn2+ efflux pump MntP
MNIASTLLLAFAMSTDAFAAAVGKGATLRRPRIREALRTGLIFGVIEAITPLVGWVLGKAAAPHVASWDHWIAFSLLFVLGAHMTARVCAHPRLTSRSPTATVSGCWRSRDSPRVSTQWRWARDSLSSM